MSYAYNTRKKNIKNKNTYTVDGQEYPAIKGKRSERVREAFKELAELINKNN